MKTVLLRLTGFTVFPLLSLVTPLVLLPIISGIVGGQGIASVISGQAIGVFAATLVTWGWSVDGPVAVARATTDVERAAVYLRSIRDRLVLSAIAFPIACLLAALIAVPGFKSAAAAMALASGLAGLSPAWFCIGLGDPRLLAYYDTVPRFAATLVAAPLLYLAHELWIYTALLIVASIVSLAAFHRRFTPGGSWFPTSWRQSFSGIWGQRHTAGISMAGSVYASTPAPIATATTSISASASLSTADTLYRFGIFTVVALGNALQSWTIEPGQASRSRRHSLAIGSHVALGLVGLGILVVAGPFASELLFAGQARATTELCFYYGVAFFFLSASTPLMRNILIPAGRHSLVLRWTLISAVAGVVFMLVAGLSGNAPGIALGMALSEAVLCISLLPSAVRELRRAEAVKP